MELRARCRGRGRARQGLDTEWEYLDEAQEQLRHSARTQGPGPCARARELAPTRGLPPPPLTERGEERKKERKRNITLCLPLMCPLLETWPETQACAVTWNQTGDPFVHRLLLSSHQPVLFKVNIDRYASCRGFLSLSCLFRRTFPLDVVLVILQEE
ncbi:uncharacterized protein AAES06_022430 isoform 3-T4 [Glossophaga mutica]